MVKRSELHTDVLVLGSGPSGFAAAYTAAKNGANVILVEQSGDIGGISTSGLMSHWTGSCGSPLFNEILRRSAEKNEGGFKNKITNLIDPEKLKTLYLEMLYEVGCKVMLYSFAEDAICEADNVLGATVVNKSGIMDIYSRVTVDATGDGDIAAKAGAEFILGRESDNKMQPATLMFKVGGVDYERAVFLGSFESTYDTPNGELQTLARQHIPYPAGHILTYESTLPGVVTCNMTNAIDIDGKAHYEVKFAYNGFEFEYEIAVEDGAVLKAEKEAEESVATVTQKASEKDKAPEKTEATIKEENTKNKNNNGYISVETAKQKALDNAGVKAKDAVFLKAYYDFDDLVPHYEIKFNANGYEYEYEIMAADGKVIDKDVERERNSVKVTSDKNDYIGAEKAKEAAYKHAKVNAPDVKFAKTELDRDDMVVHYDVEFVAGRYEYEYEINAETGKVIAFDKEIKD